jgi:hypothetical protein
MIWLAHCPDTARAGSIGAIDLLRHDALGAEPASVSEDDRAVLDDVFIEQDAGLGVRQQPCQRCLAVEERAIAHILAVMLDQVEGIRCSRYPDLGPPSGRLISPVTCGKDMAFP